MFVHEKGLSRIIHLGSFSTKYKQLYYLPEKSIGPTAPLMLLCSFIRAMGALFFFCLFGFDQLADLPNVKNGFVLKAICSEIRATLQPLPYAIHVKTFEYCRKLAY